jgi:ornithine carbamoyltransferase
MKNLLNISDLSRDEILQIINAAIDNKINKKQSTNAKDKTLAMIFEKSSTRTRISFELAIKQLGGLSIMLDKDHLHLGKRETLADTAKTLSQYADIIMMRSNSHSTLENLTKYSSVPVINGLSDLSHPCQTLATLMTIKEIKGTLENINISWFGPISNVAHSLIDAANMNLGFSLNVYCPKYYQDIYFQKLKDMNKEISLDNINLKELNLNQIDPAEVIYTDTWFSMGDIEDSTKIEMLTKYSVNQDLMSKANPGCIFLHCLPANRSQEVSGEVIDGPQSYVWQEAQNRLHVQKELLLNLL